LKKPIREAFLPLASNPDIQYETMKKLGIDARTPEQKYLDEIREEEMKKLNGGMMEV
jgi:hypothetical protein